MQKINARTKHLSFHLNSKPVREMTLKNCAESGSKY